MGPTDWLFEAAADNTNRYRRLTRDMAASQGARSRRAQAAILGAAWHVFQERDFEAVRMEDLAERAGMSRPAVYSYFPSKRTIFLAIAMAVNTRFHALAEAFTGVRRGASLDLDLAAWASSALTFFEETFWVTQVWDRAVVTDGSLREEGVRQGSRAWRVMGVHMDSLRGSSTGHNSLAEGMLVLSMVERSWFYWARSESPFPRSDLVLEVTATIKAMIGPTSND
jgi:AcrR family transcriptional regulator